MLHSAGRAGSRVVIDPKRAAIRLAKVQPSNNILIIIIIMLIIIMKQNTGLPGICLRVFSSMKLKLNAAGARFSLKEIPD